MNRNEILQWLLEEDEKKLQELWAWADRVRKEHVGDAVHLRGLIEISNVCARQCGYCGIRAGNEKIERYRMSREEILACARRAVALGYGTVVMQSGEDYGIEADCLAELIRTIKQETALAVTLSVGERSYDELKLWRQAGADRYLLKLETSDVCLYHRIHPAIENAGCGTREAGCAEEKGRGTLNVQSRDEDHGQDPPLTGVHPRVDILHTLRKLGYETGSGVMVGLPGQTYTTLANDIATFGEMDLDMIGVGPFIPHPATPLGNVECGTWDVGRGQEHGQAAPSTSQVRNDEMTACKAVALTRLVCPQANIPSTTALAILDRQHGRELGLTRGANVVMPNLTPAKYRVLYEIYPGKAARLETAEECQTALQTLFKSIGRHAGQGRGNRTGFKVED